ncbi:MAG TPA: hypothetical protein VMG41_09120 [Gemmatimonadales bacterium]|nr:hypothetical protein [Gemmatimonadales bacterium]
MHGFRFTATALILALAAAWTPAAAQVGHPPGSSPYRDIVPGMSVTALYGSVGGGGGVIGVGPHHGSSYGVRFDIRAGTPVQFGFALGYADLERLIVSAADSVAKRVSGPVSQNVVMIETAIQLNLTGKKSWNHLAPYLAGSIGVAVGSGLPAGHPDSSGYKFGTKIYLAPTAGVRVMLGNSIQVRLEIRDLLWKLSYPSSYNVEPAAQPSSDPTKPNSVLKGGSLTEWTGNREFRVGLGFGF